MSTSGRGQKTIRVVDAKRVLTDVTLLQAEELRTVLHALASEFEPDRRQAILALEQVAADLKEIQAHGPAGGDFITMGKPDSAALMNEVTLRQLLNSPAVIPVVAKDADKVVAKDASKSASGPIRVRPAVRKAALTVNTAASARERRLRPYRDIGVAAEQAVFVEGLKLDPSRQGSVIVDVLAGGVDPGLKAMASSGAFAAPVFSTVLAQTTSKGPLVNIAGVQQYSSELVQTLRSRLGSALAFHMSGAGAFLSLSEALTEALSEASGAREPRGTNLQGIARAIVQKEAQGVDSATRPALEAFVASLAEVFTGTEAGGQTVASTPDEFAYVLTPLLDIYRVGGLGAYYYALTQGLEAEGVRRFLQRSSAALAEKALLAELDRAIFAEIARARHYTIIIEDKLGAKRLRQIEVALATSGKSQDDPAAIKALLRKREQEIVENEYENRRHEWEAQVNNTCPHVRLAYRLRMVRSSREATEILGKLSAYFKAPQAKSARGPGPGPRPAAELEWLLCKNCGFRTICPHVRDLITMESRNLPYDTIRTRLVKYAVKYSSPGSASVATNYSYFCRICSERLAEFIEEDRTAEVLGAVGNLDDYVRKTIWKEALNAAELVRFPMPVDPRQFASTAVGVCHPLLLLAEAAMLKRGRRAAAKPRGQALTADDPFGDEETIDARTHLYVVLFVYAYILNLINSSQELSPDRRLGFEGVRPGAKMSAYAKTILETILAKYAGIISRIEDITPEFIADRFREAFRRFVGDVGPQELVAADEAKVVVNEVVALSPTYNYIAIAARVFGKLPISRPLSPPAARREFETVLGRTLPAILEDRATDSKSELVQKLLGVRPTARGTRRVAVEYPRGADPLYVYSAPEVNFLRQMSRVPAAFEKSVDMAPFDALESLAVSMSACDERCVVESVGGREAARKPGKKTRKPVKKAQKPAKKPQKRASSFNNFLRADPILSPAASGLYLETYRLFTDYTVNVVDAASMQAFAKRLDAARIRERGYLLLRAATAVKNYRYFGFDATRRFGRHDDPRPADRRRSRITTPGRAGFEVPLTYLYDENGLYHTWVKGANIYVYENSETVELTRKQIVADISKDYANNEEGPIHGRTLVDVKCSVCGVLLSQIHTLDAEKARVSLEALAEFDAFFAFYDARCPVSEMHDFGTGENRKCTKCGLDESLIFDYNTPKNATVARAYYDKFLSQYREQKAAATSSASVLADQSRDLSDPVADAVKKFRKYVESWKPDYSLIVQAAEFAEVPVAAFETLGATEGREYPEVLSGVGAPPPPDSLDDPRLLTVDSDVRVFTTAYNRLRFVGRFPKTPLEAEAVLNEAKVPKDAYESLSTHLPEVFDDYSAKRLAFLQLRSPEDILAFTIESLARMTLAAAGIRPRANDSAPNWSSDLRRLFAKRQVQAIIRSERLLAKNGPFNFKIFGDEDIGGGSLGGIDAPADDFGDHGEDALDAIVAEGGEDGADNPFSLEMVDIEDDDPNLEPA